MNSTGVGLALLALAGFLLGGVLAMWRAGNRVVAVALAVGVALATGGAVAWLA